MLVKHILTLISLKPMIEISSGTRMAACNARIAPIANVSLAAKSGWTSVRFFNKVFHRLIAFFNRKSCFDNPFLMIKVQIFKVSLKRQNVDQPMPRGTLSYILAQKAYQFSDALAPKFCTIVLTLPAKSTTMEFYQKPLHQSQNRRGAPKAASHLLFIKFS